MNLRAIIPNKLKLKFRLFKRYLSDRKINFAFTSNERIRFSNLISTVQEIKHGPFFDNKVHNIKTASHKVETILIKPEEIFSFWKIVGSPSKKNNFRKGRNIIKGKVSEEIGGGLCQLSSIIYITALKANLKIEERHNHSIDIYKEAERFTPLGSDATVVHGYKDLRIKNSFDFPIRFSFSFIENQIICNLESLEKIPENKLDFIRNYKANLIEVSTTINSNHQCYSIYKTMVLKS
jgi:vancomycin resistance protein VanW